MFKVEQLCINPDTPQELQKISTDFVGYVIEKASRKVVRTNVLSRRALPEWYDACRKDFSEATHIYCLGTISLLGSIMGVQVVEVSEEDVKKANDEKHAKRKPGDNYHVN